MKSQQITVIEAMESPFAAFLEALDFDPNGTTTGLLGAIILDLLSKLASSQGLGQLRQVVRVSQIGPLARPLPPHMRMAVAIAEPLCAIVKSATCGRFEFVVRNSTVKNKAGPLLARL